MEGNNWQRVKQIFADALKRPPDERDAFVSEACQSDLGLRHEVEALIEADEQAEAACPEPTSEPKWVGRKIGKYRLQRILGEGGMGVVYLAEQEHPRRNVALKLIKGGLLSPAIRQRFNYEAGALGRLHHPGIVQVYDAGTVETELGDQPFVAMEFAPGQTLTEYAKQVSLSPRDCMSLMAKIADAVHHAHQQGVIHRDLKPANILMDSAGQPKILDFGVARAIDADQSNRPSITMTGEMIGTLSYMSPEQCTGSPDGVDVRSDVYSLGVIGYELLAHRLPHKVRHTPITEAVRLICEKDPLPLGKIDRRLRGDVETIIAKALERDRTRRYQSAAEFAGDLERHLDGRAIVARSDNSWYILHKALHRHRRSLGLVSAVLLSVLGVAVYAWFQSHQRTQANERRVTALVPYLRAQRMIERRQGMAHDQWKALANEAINQLTEAVKIDPTFATAWYQRGRVRLHLKNAEQNTLVLDRSLRDFEMAHESAGDAGFPPALWAAGNALCAHVVHRPIRHRFVYSPDPPHAHEAMGKARDYYAKAARLDQSDHYVKLSQALLLLSTSQVPEAIAMLEQVVADAVGQYQDEAHFLLALAWSNLAISYWYGLHDQIDTFAWHNPRWDSLRAQQHIERALELDRTNDQALWAASILARRNMRIDDAKRYIEQALEIRPRSIPYHNARANIHAVAGELQKAINILQQLVVWYPQSSYCWRRLARAQLWVGDYAAMEEAAGKAIELVPDHEDAWSNLILALRKQARFQEAEAAFHDAINRSPNNFGAWMNHAEALYIQGRLDEAAETYARIFKFKLDDSTAHLNFARVLKALGRQEEAFEQLKQISSCPNKNPDITAHLVCEYLASDVPAHRDQASGIELAVFVSRSPRIRPWTRAIITLADYRAGRFEQALTRTSEIDSCDAAGCWARLVESASHQALTNRRQALASMHIAEDLLADLTIDDARLITFYHEVAAQLGVHPRRLVSTRPTLYEEEF